MEGLGCRGSAEQRQVVAPSPGRRRCRALCILDSVEVCRGARKGHGLPLQGTWDQGRPTLDHKRAVGGRKSGNFSEQRADC